MSTLLWLIALEIHIRKQYEKLTATYTNLFNTYTPQAKSYGLAVLDRVRRAIVLLADWLDEKLPTENPDCDKSILCLHEGRHKKGCFAYTVPIKKYSRDLTNA